MLEICIVIAVITFICYAINLLLGAYANRKFNLGIYNIRAEVTKALGDKATTGFLWAVIFIPIAIALFVGGSKIR